MDTQAYMELMERLAHAWSTQDTEVGLACFTEDALYTEPPDIQIYRGHTELRPYFAALQPGTFMRFHNLWFDENKQVGAGEYSFGMTDKPAADHGVVIIEIRDGKIAFWREYQRKGPTEFEDFIAPDDKDWKWHIGNYP